MAAAKNMVIGITGGSCSGKSSLARIMRSHLGTTRAVIVAQDDYYLDMSRLKREGGKLPNFDAPEAVEWPRLVADIKSLAAGSVIDKPVYDFTTHSRAAQTEAVSPAPYIILEGMLILTQPEMRAVIDHSLYLEAPPDLRLARRLVRDVSERGRTSDDVIEQFETFVEPAHEKYVSPSRRFADVVVSQDEYLYETDALLKRLTQMWTPAKQ